ncbi:MAG: hypothetical protein AB8I08_06595 [Sandaracinaceae bacterium]
MAGRASRGARAFVLLSVLAALPLVGGCIEYTDRVMCSNGTVLNDDDDCVAPPVPDGGVSIATCSDLCAAMTTFDAAQTTCVTDLLAMAGPLPAACMEDLNVEANCSACVAASSTADMNCAVAGSSCQ